MNIFRKTPSSRGNKREIRLGKAASAILGVGLPMILIYLCGFLFMISDLEREMPSYIIARVHFYTLEHIVMSAFLIIAGALLIDILERRISKGD